MREEFPSQTLSTRLRAKLGSLIWRLLTRYGRIKYRYLLPLYRLFGLLPNQRKARGTSEPSVTVRGARALVDVLGPPFRFEQLSAVIARVRNSKGAVIFLPSVGWEIVNAQRTHHLAREFARQGYVAVFDSSNSYDDVNGFKEIEPNLFLFRGPDNVLPEIADPILWTLTYNFDKRDAYATATRTVYDWIDEFEVFNFERSFLERNHKRALEEATLVVSVARRLHERVSQLRPDALYLPNGVEYERFADDTVPLPVDSDIDRLRRNERPIAGYYGAMSEWLDYDLLDAVAELRSDWSFLLIGPMYDNSLRERGRSVLSRPNVLWIAQREYRELPAYLRLFDVAMIPFVINDITLATSPLKLYEYFAGAKPVIATPMTECQAYPEVLIARNPIEFSRALDVAKARAADKAFRKRLRQLGRENSWNARVKSVVEHLQDRT